MEKKLYECECCKKTVTSEDELRQNNWLEIRGGTTHGISVWLKEPRKKIKGVAESYMLTIGYQNRDYHFCSIDCITTLLNGNESI